jgi:hypothetical protein
MLDKTGSIPIHNEQENGKFSLFIIPAILEIHQSDIEKYLEDLYFSYDGHIYLILKEKDQEKLFINNKKFISDYDLSEQLTLYIFKMNEDDMNVFNLFFLGEWSKFPKDFITKLKQFTNLNFGNSKPSQKLTRTYSIIAAAMLKSKFLKLSLEQYLGDDIPSSNELMQEPSNINYITIDELFLKYTIEELE